ncbi:methyltransferase small [Fibrisoma limi BUZ 3]|uniref:tRNA1(Val) (adenine(37)-N6)-methyltransferase n=1 Tax=Fibrisoma limi BUZ 3 TaxID=1185876 RepID=I2GE14_9BACT|nr:methyltransferase [Fibrisoma limi]CCH52139.1 methyltransferase small [Fibrisoma limi BUZ 3]
MFRFKQFIIQQDRTAMKVCTDACVLGAFADVTAGRILDIGTGTGLLALMAAQRNPDAFIDAVELDDAAYGQASENVSASAFRERIWVIHSRIQAFGSEEKRYDRILTNPPFYSNHLRSPDAAVNRALHTDDLPFTELIEAVGRLLKTDGQWWVLLPPYETGVLTQLAGAIGLWPFSRLHLRHHARKSVFRIITGLQYGTEDVTDETLDIYEPDGRTYTAAFRALLQPFYLIF